MHRGFATIAAFLVVTAWAFRKNTPLLFAIIATICAVASGFSTSWTAHSELIEKLGAILWLVFMLIAGVLAVNKWLQTGRKKRAQH